MKLVANECANCRRPVGYVTPKALQIPTMCLLCALDKEVMEEWGHTIDKREKPVREVCRDLRWTLNRQELE
jgi:hypothetical protein